MARAETFKGYGPYVGYEFLRAEIAAHDFGARGVTIGADEVFVSDGGKSDSANIQEIFAADCVVALMDPVYPVYADSNVMAGTTGPGRRERPLRGHRLPALHGRQRLPAGAARPPRRPDLSLLSEQPHRRGGDARGAQALGRVRPRPRRGHPVRRGLRGLHARPGAPPLDLRDRGRARGGHRVSQLLQECRLHRHAAGLHDRAEGDARTHGRRHRR